MAALCASLLVAAQTPIFQSAAYSVYSDRVVQGNYVARALSPVEISSDYISPSALRYSPDIAFKFSINGRDNEMRSGLDHRVTLRPQNGRCSTDVVFGKALSSPTKQDSGDNLPENTQWTIRLDLRDMLAAFKTKGYYTLYNGERLAKDDFKAVYIAGSSAPLMWDFNNLYTRPELELKDADGDGIFEVTLTMNRRELAKQTAPLWKLSKDIAAFPSYRSSSLLADAVYNLSTEEMMRAVEPDSTFRTGQEWAGVWTRDISYSIILSMAYLQPKVSKYSLDRKVKNGFIIQDTGTGGAYPVSTDRMIWATAAWEVYKATGDEAWLRHAYAVVKKSIEADQINAYDDATGLVRGESSFLDWREQTYPRWMQPADIYASEALGTNAAHYQANSVLAKMAKQLGHADVAAKHEAIAQKIKSGINQHLWLEDKGYYAQFLYGRTYLTASPRAEALGEALCILFGIADSQKAAHIVDNMPVVAFGLPCIFPQIPNIPPYHNNGIWPFVQAYWTLASAAAGNEASVVESMAAIYRPAALFLTNKENFVAEDGDFADTQINSSNMLWSLAGNLGMVHRVLFGISFDDDALRFRPFVPKVFEGERSLNNFRLRNAVVDITVSGFGSRIARFEIDGKPTDRHSLPYTLEGHHSVKIILANNDFAPSKTNRQVNRFTPETPVVSFEKGRISWSKIGHAAHYLILKNGKQCATTTDTVFAVAQKGYAEYQAIAVAANGDCSFASEPFIVADKAASKRYEASVFFTDAADKLNEAPGKVAVAVDENRLLTIPVEVKTAGLYAVTFTYANGNGPINTENKCAIRSLRVGGATVGTFVFPQRGTGEWGNFGNTNTVVVALEKGKQKLELSFLPENENMNGAVNQAIIESVTLAKIN